MTGPTAKGEATRQQILAVASRVFAERGYSDTRMDDIIRASGMTKGAIYFHFHSKHALAVAAVEQHKRHWLALGREEVARHEDPAEQLRSLGDLLIALAAQGEAGWNAVRLAEQLRTDGTDGPGSPLLEWIELVGGIIARGQELGAFSSSLASEDAAVIIVAAFDGLKTASDRLSSGSGDDFSRRARALLDLVAARLSR